MNKQVTTSKRLAYVTSIIFIFCVVMGFIGTFMSGSASINDVAVFVISISTSGGIYGACMKYYFNKAKSENVIKEQLVAYKEISKIRLDYNEKMMKLKKKYEMTNDDIREIEDDSPIDDVCESLINGVNETLNTDFNEAKETINIES